MVIRKQCYLLIYLFIYLFIIFIYGGKTPGDHPETAEDYFRSIILEISLFLHRVTDKIASENVVPIKAFPQPCIEH